MNNKSKNNEQQYTVNVPEAKGQMGLEEVQFAQNILDAAVAQEASAKVYDDNVVELSMYRTPDRLRREPQDARIYQFPVDQSVEFEEQPRGKQAS